jgi:putative hemolysin
VSPHRPGDKIAKGEEMGRPVGIIFAALCLAVTTILTGCSTSYGPVPYGKDSYIVRASDWGNGSDAIKEANTHCASMGKVMMPRTFFQGRLIFSCVDKDDPEYRRPNMGNLPNTNININR